MIEWAHQTCAPQRARLIISWESDARRCRGGCGGPDAGGAAEWGSARRRRRCRSSAAAHSRRPQVLPPTACVTLTALALHSHNACFSKQQPFTSPPQVPQTHPPGSHICCGGNPPVPVAPPPFLMPPSSPSLTQFSLPSTTLPAGTSVSRASSTAPPLAATATARGPASSAATAASAPSRTSE